MGGNITISRAHRKKERVITGFAKFASPARQNFSDFPLYQQQTGKNNPWMKPPI